MCVWKPSPKLGRAVKANGDQSIFGPIKFLGNPKGVAKADTLSIYESIELRHQNPDIDSLLVGKDSPTLGSPFARSGNSVSSGE